MGYFERSVRKHTSSISHPLGLPLSSRNRLNNHFHQPQTQPLPLSSLKSSMKPSMQQSIQCPSAQPLLTQPQDRQRSQKKSIQQSSQLEGLLKSYSSQSTQSP